MDNGHKPYTVFYSLKVFIELKKKKKKKKKKIKKKFFF